MKNSGVKALKIQKKKKVRSERMPVTIFTVQNNFSILSQSKKKNRTRTKSEKKNKQEDKQLRVEEKDKNALKQSKLDKQEQKEANIEQTNKKHSRSKETKKPILLWSRIVLSCIYFFSLSSNNDETTIKRVINCRRKENSKGREM